jgi:hypothetical protein
MPTIIAPLRKTPTENLIYNLWLMSRCLNLMLHVYKQIPKSKYFTGFL